jgi:hypothetical protein
MHGSADWLILVSSIMAWGKWMCPNLSLAAELALEAQKRAIQTEGLKRPEALAKLCCQMLENDARRILIINGAVKRIAELECELGMMAENDYQNEG